MERKVTTIVFVDMVYGFAFGASYTLGKAGKLPKCAKVGLKPPLKCAKVPFGAHLDRCGTAGSSIRTMWVCRTRERIRRIRRPQGISHARRVTGIANMNSALGSPNDEPIGNKSFKFISARRNREQMNLFGNQTYAKVQRNQVGYKV